MEDLQRLPYTEQVITEAMRLYPPVWGIFRDCKVADEIGGYPIAPGTVVLLSPWVVHHDAHYYAEPEAFRPERWDKASKQTYPSLCLFSLWRRTTPLYWKCLRYGRITPCLCNVSAKNWHFTLASSEPLELVPTITIRPKNGIHLIAHKRS